MGYRLPFSFKAEFRSYFRYECWTSNVLLLHNSLDYLTFTWWSMKTTKSWLFLIESQSKDEPTRGRPINRDPTSADWSLQPFLLHVLPLCNVWQHLTTCASRVMQVYASRAIALNKSRPKILAHIASSWMQIALYLLQAVSYCLHLVMRLWLKSSTFLFYSELKTHCLCTVPTCHICIIACYYQKKLGTLRRSVQGVY